MNSGVLDLNTRRKVSFAPAGAATAVTAAASGSTKQSNAAEALRAGFKERYFIVSLDACCVDSRFFGTCVGDVCTNHSSSWRRFGGGQAESQSRVLRLEVAQRDGQRIGGVGGLRDFRHRQQRADHHLHLPLLRLAIARDG